MKQYHRRFSFGLILTTAFFLMVVSCVQTSQVTTAPSSQPTTPMPSAVGGTAPAATSNSGVGISTQNLFQTITGTLAPTAASTQPTSLVNSSPGGVTPEQNSSQIAVQTQATADGSTQSTQLLTPQSGASTENSSLNTTPTISQTLKTKQASTGSLINEVSTPLAPLIAIHPRQTASVLLPRLLSALLIIMGTWGISTLINRLIYNLLNRVHSQIRVFVSRLVYFAVWIGGVLWILSVFQVQVATLTAIIGTLGLALSLASQDLAKNFIAGIYLLIERPFKIGDEITYGAFSGKVEFIDLRITKIITDTNQQVIIPNSLLLSQVVTRKIDSTIVIQNPPDESNK